MQFTSTKKIQKRFFFTSSKNTYLYEWPSYIQIEFLFVKNEFCPASRVFANSLGDLGSILGHVMPKYF